MFHRAALKGDTLALGRFACRFQWCVRGGTL